MSERWREFRTLVVRFIVWPSLCWLCRFFTQT